MSSSYTTLCLLLLQAYPLKKVWICTAQKGGEQTKQAMGAWGEVNTLIQRFKHFLFTGLASCKHGGDCEEGGQ